MTLHGTASQTAVTGRRDVLLRGGTLYGAAGVGDGTTGDVAVAGGMVSGLGRRLDAEAAEVIDCSGCIVCPGLIDLHSHIYRGATRSGVDVAAAHFKRAVAVVNDAGSAGSSTFAGFRDYIAARHPGRVFAFLNASVIGLSDGRFGELLDQNMFAPDEAASIITQHPDVIRGLKIRLSRPMAGDNPRSLLTQVACLADELRVPLMVHIGDTGMTMTQILDRLPPGSIITHCYTPGDNGTVGADGKVLPAVLEAQARGVWFDVGHGTKQWEWERTERALQSGLLPDSISSDLSTNNQHGPAFDLVTTMSKMVAVGMPLAAVIRAVTTGPARILGIDGETSGKIAVGVHASLSVVRWADRPAALPDTCGVIRAIPVLRPVGVLWRGRFEPSAPERGPSLPARLDVTRPDPGNEQRS